MYFSVCGAFDVSVLILLLDKIILSYSMIYFIVYVKYTSVSHDFFNRTLHPKYHSKFQIKRMMIQVKTLPLNLFEIKLKV